MLNKILLDNNEHEFSEADLPGLITYGEKMGGSQFSMTLISRLFLGGSKVLILTAYPMARDNFMEQVKGSETKVAYIESASQLNESKDFPAIILKSGDEELFLEVAARLEDIKDRVVLIKNIETFSGKIFEAVSGFQKLIFSGDIDQCIAKDKILAAKPKTIIAFSHPQTTLPFQIPKLEKHQGYLWTQTNQGIVTLK